MNNSLARLTFSALVFFSSYNIAAAQTPEQKVEFTQVTKKPNAEHVATIKKHAQLCGDAQIKGDFATFIPYVPKKLLKLMGGKEGLTQTITKGTADMKSQGISFDSVTMGNPEEPTKIENLLASLVPQKLILNIPQGRLVTDTHLLAISEDDGETWVFLDCATMNDHKLGIIYPALSGKIKLPPRIEPRLE